MIYNMFCNIFNILYIYICYHSEFGLITQLVQTWCCEHPFNPLYDHHCVGWSKSQPLVLAVLVITICVKNSTHVLHPYLLLLMYWYSVLCWLPTCTQSWVDHMAPLALISRTHIFIIIQMSQDSLTWRVVIECDWYCYCYWYVLQLMLWEQFWLLLLLLLLMWIIHMHA